MVIISDFHSEDASSILAALIFLLLFLGLRSGASRSFAFGLASHIFCLAYVLALL